MQPLQRFEKLSLDEAAKPTDNPTIAAGSFPTGQSVTTAGSLPIAYKARFGLVGEVLADALPQFSLALVGVVAEYIKEYTEADLGIKNALLNAKSVRVSDCSIPDVLSKFKTLGEHVTSLDLVIPAPLPFYPYFPCFEFDNLFIEQHMLPNLPNLQSLRIWCEDSAPLCLGQFCHLRHLEIASPCYPERGNVRNFLEALKKGLTQLQSFSMRSNTPSEMCEYLPFFQELTELTLGPTDLATDVLSSLQDLKKLRRLKLNANERPFNNIARRNSILQTLPLEVLCLENWKYKNHFLESRPKTLKILILKDCNNIVNPSEYPDLQVICVDSMTKEGREKLREYFKFI